MKQGTEQTTFAYDAKHRLASSTDAAGNAIGYVYDDADRVIEKRLPGNRTYTYAYDADGNVKSLTTPRGKVHTFGSTGDDRPKSYTPPGAGAYSRAYSTERTLDATALPSGATQANGYDAAGRLKSEDHVQTKRAFAYDGDLDRFDTVTRALADGGGEQGIAYKLRRHHARVAGVHRRGGRQVRVHDRRPDPADEREAHRGRARRSPARWRSTATGWRPRPARSRSSAPAPPARSRRSPTASSR